MLQFYRRLAEEYGRLSVVTKIGLVVGLAVLTSILAVAVVVWLPADHFCGGESPKRSWRRYAVVRWVVIGLKNVIGAVLLPLGILMALPLVPGPGLVFILIGLSLLDFPGKRKFERRLFGIPSVSKFINDMRERFGKPPLRFE